MMAMKVAIYIFHFFFQAEDGIRDGHVTGVQTCALPISDDSDEFVLVDLQADVLERFEALVAEHERLIDVLDLDLVVAHCRHFRSLVHRRSCQEVSFDSIISRVRSMSRPKMPITMIPTKMVGRS